MNTEFIHSCLSNISTVIISVFTTQYFFHCFFDKQRLSRFVSALIYILTSLAFFSSLQFVNNRVLNMTLLVGCTFAISLLFEMRWPNRMLFTLIFIAISTICEFIIAMLILLLFSIEFSELREGIYQLAGMLLSKFLALILFATLKIKKHHSLTGKSKQDWSILFVLPTTTIFVLFVQFMIMSHVPTNSPLKTPILFSMICLFICNIHGFRFIDTIWKSIESEQKFAVADNLLNEQVRQYASMIENHQEIIKIQHDYKNVLLGIQSELIGERYDSAIKYIQSQLSIVSLSNSPISGNQTVDTVVKVKMDTAKTNGIAIDFQFRNIQNQNLKVNSIDLSILLGNALDNAIEATEKVLAPSCKTITLLIVLKDDIINIVIKNPVIKHVDTNHLKTDKKDKRLHGYGIINMQTIVKRYDGSLFFTCQDLSFGTTILLPNRNPTPVNYE